MAILIADTKSETETDAWYQFYVDKMSDIADLPTSQSTGASYKVKKLARPTSIAYCIEMAAVYALESESFGPHLRSAGLRTGRNTCTCSKS